MPSNGTKYLNGGYWPSWKNDESGVCLDLSTITHVSYAFAGIHEDGTIFLENPAGLRAWTERKVEHPELKISLAIGGGHTLAGDRFAAMAANIEMVQRFVTSTKAAVDEYGLDGVDIDWEYPKTAEQGQHYLGLMTDLRAALPKPLKLSTALPAGEWVLQYIPLAELASLVDIVNLMAYDFAGANFANVAFTAHHANLFAPSTGGSNGDSAINYIGRRGFPVNKILLGVPLYGRAFGGANWINEKFSGTGGMGEYPVKDLPKPGMKEFFDDTAIAVFAVGEGQFVTYDNAQSVQKKAAYVKSRGLAGLFFWQLTADRCGEQSLVRAGFEELGLQV
jgi:chitinase